MLEAEVLPVHGVGLLGELPHGEIRVAIGAPLDPFRLLRHHLIVFSYLLKNLDPLSLITRRGGVGEV
jgi:hypothetical protein